MTSGIDYKDSGLSLRRALVAEAKRLGSRRGESVRIEWSGLLVQNSDMWRVPPRGQVTLDIISYRPSLWQGIDLKVSGGFRLQNGSLVKHLRTWCDPIYEDTVSYEYEASDRYLFTWNVCEWSDGEGRQWEDWAGMVVEAVSENERLYQCSSGRGSAPDFDDLTYRVRILPAAAGSLRQKRRTR